MVLLDLEDAVAQVAKLQARITIVDAIQHVDWGETVLFVRINGWTSSEMLDDVLAVCGRSGDRLDGVVLPKTESAASVVALDLVLSQIELNAGLPQGHFGIELQIETAQGLANVDEICGASSRLETVSLGSVDFAASIGMPSHTDDSTDPMFPGGLLYEAEMRLLSTARAYGLQVLDGPHIHIQDLDGLKRSAERARRMGFDGKWVLHPSQIAIVNDIFRPSQEQFDRALRHVEALKRLTELGTGVGLLDGEMIDDATGKLAETIVRRGSAAGMIASHD